MSKKSPIAALVAVMATVVLLFGAPAFANDPEEASTTSVEVVEEQASEPAPEPAPEAAPALAPDPEPVVADAPEPSAPEVAPTAAPAPAPATQPDEEEGVDTESAAPATMPDAVGLSASPEAVEVIEAAPAEEPAEVPLAIAADSGQSAGIIVCMERPAGYMAVFVPRLVGQTGEILPGPGQKLISVVYGEQPPPELMALYSERCQELVDLGPGVPAPPSFPEGTTVGPDEMYGPTPLPGGEVKYTFGSGVRSAVLEGATEYVYPASPSEGYFFPDGVTSLFYVVFPWETTVEQPTVISPSEDWFLHVQEPGAGNDNVVVSPAYDDQVVIVEVTHENGQVVAGIAPREGYALPEGYHPVLVFTEYIGEVENPGGTDGPDRPDRPTWPDRPGRDGWGHRPDRGDWREGWSGHDPNQSAIVSVAETAVGDLSPTVKPTTPARLASTGVAGVEYVLAGVLSLLVAGKLLVMWGKSRRRPAQQ